MREGHDFENIAELDSGITPACAGRTQLLELGFREVEDHPRMCGKDRTILKFEFERLGSPPHVREGLDRIT